MADMIGRNNAILSDDFVMMSLGFLALGAFIGGLVGLFLFNTKEEGWRKPITGLTTMLGAVISGAPIALAQYIVADSGLSSAFTMYPVGLVLGILSPYLQLAGQNWKEGRWFLAITHYAAYILIIIFGVSVFIWPQAIIPHFAIVDRYFLELDPT
ncbi:MAG: hypothetical protein AAF683_09795 [Pseudomonadota bacterium]